MMKRHPAGNPRRVSSSGREPILPGSGSRPVGEPRASRPRRSPRAPGPPWWRHPAWLAAFAALALYLPALGFGFVRDDHELIAENPFLRRAGWLARLLGSDYWASSGGDSGLWRPLVLLSYWLDGRLGGWSASWFHGVNAVLHAATTAMVVVLASQRGRSRAAALIAGLWFAAMPVHVESVAWISGRTDVLCALAFGLALWADRRARERGARWPGVVAVAAFALALLAKEAALPLVLAFAVAERIEREDGRVRASWLGPYAAVSAVYLVAHQAIARGAGIPAWLDAATLARRHWAGWTMLPEDVAFFWPWFPHAAERLLALPASALAPAVLAGAALTLAAFAVLAWLTWRRAPAALPVAMFLLPLTPPIALAIARGYVAHAERLLYLSSIGAAWLLALALDRAERTASWRVPARVLGLALVAASAWVTVRVLPDWRSDATMYAAMVRAQPSHAEGRIGLASTLLDQGRVAEATAQLDAAERLEPRHPALQVSRALVALRSDDWPVVLDRARRARAVDPGRTDAALLEAQALVRLDRRAEADRALDSLLARSPGLPQAEALQGELKLAEGHPAEAAQRLRAAAGWMPGDPALWRALGAAELESGHPGPARDALRRAVTLAPAAYPVWLQLAWASHLAGDAAGRDAAMEHASRLPGAADGRVDSLRRRFASVPSK